MKNEKSIYTIITLVATSFVVAFLFVHALVSLASYLAQ
jgi:hypothetical protein